MSLLRHITWSIALASTSLATLAQTAAEHAQHHPAVVAQAQAQPAMPMGAMAPKPGASNAMPSMAAMDKHMKAMQAMHDKMASAKTPAERERPDGRAHEAHAGAACR
jgi:hypothetical protein